MEQPTFSDSRLREQYAELRSRFSQLEQLKARVTEDILEHAEFPKDQSLALVADSSDVDGDTTELLRQLCAKVSEQSKEITALREEIVSRRWGCVARGSATDESVDITAMSKVQDLCLTSATSGLNLPPTRSPASGSSCASSWPVTSCHGSCVTDRSRSATCVTQPVPALTSTFETYGEAADLGVGSLAATVAVDALPGDFPAGQLDSSKEAVTGSTSAGQPLAGMAGNVGAPAASTCVASAAVSSPAVLSALISAGWYGTGVAVDIHSGWTTPPPPPLPPLAGPRTSKDRVAANSADGLGYATAPIAVASRPKSYIHSVATSSSWSGVGIEGDGSEGVADATTVDAAGSIAPAFAAPAEAAEDRHDSTKVPVRHSADAAAGSEAARTLGPSTNPAPTLIAKGLPLPGVERSSSVSPSAPRISWGSSCGSLTFPPPASRAFMRSRGCLGCLDGRRGASADAPSTSATSFQPRAAFAGTAPSKAAAVVTAARYASNSVSAPVVSSPSVLSPECSALAAIAPVTAPPPSSSRTASTGPLLQALGRTPPCPPKGGSVSPLGLRRLERRPSLGSHTDGHGVACGGAGRVLQSASSYSAPSTAPASIHRPVSRSTESLSAAATAAAMADPVPASAPGSSVQCAATVSSGGASSNTCRGNSGTGDAPAPAGAPCGAQRILAMRPLNRRATIGGTITSRAVSPLISPPARNPTQATFGPAAAAAVAATVRRRVAALGGGGEHGSVVSPTSAGSASVLQSWTTGAGAMNATAAASAVAAGGRGGLQHRASSAVCPSTSSTNMCRSAHQARPASKGAQTPSVPFPVPTPPVPTVAAGNIGASRLVHSSSVSRRCPDGGSPLRSSNYPTCQGAAAAPLVARGVCQSECRVGHPGSALAAVSSDGSALGANGLSTCVSVSAVLLADGGMTSPPVPGAQYPPQTAAVAAVKPASTTAAPPSASPYRRVSVSGVPRHTPTAAPAVYTDWRRGQQNPVVHGYPAAVGGIQQRVSVHAHGHGRVASASETHPVALTNQKILHQGVGVSFGGCIGHLVNHRGGPA
eukprot:TRINITY_DN29486_c0_g1_i1.p1 TRINITY_DN29486_c0_g1~~TRINITY_DN29486_c0_g1_i1.p1  ORF type:complete len:1049 (+),score=125.61 TRINITY_DN29486_c0_g1_i1:141-3287(+)